MAARVVAAARLFVQRGLDGVTMSDIAEVTGVPRATLYYHFEGKEAVFASISGRVLDDFEAMVVGVLSGPGTAAERLRSLMRAQLDFYAANVWAFLAVQLDLGRAARRAEMAERAARAYVRPVAKLLQEGVTDGTIRPVGDPLAVAAALLGTVTVASIQGLPGIDERSLGEVHEEMVALVFQGLAPVAGNAATPSVVESTSEGAPAFTGELD